MTLRTLNYGNYDIFLIMGNAGFCPSTVAGSLQYHVVLVASVFLLLMARGPSPVMVLGSFVWAQVCTCDFSRVWGSEFRLIGCKDES